MITKLQAWLVARLGDNDFIKKNLHLHYVLGDRSVSLYVSGILALFAAHFLSPTGVVGPVLVALLAFCGALAVKGGSDAILFGKVLTWMPLTLPVQILPEVAKSKGYDHFMERATQSYRAFQHPFNLAVVTIASLACGSWQGSLGMAVALGFAMWCGSHDDLFHWALKHIQKARDYHDEPWKWWTPIGLWKGWRHKKPPTERDNYMQARIGGVFALLLAVASSVLGALL